MKNFARLALLLTVFCSSNLYAAIGSVWVFGDSLLDSGNAFYGEGGETESTPYSDLVPDRAYAWGTFSDGAVWAQQLSAVLGVTLNPSLAPGGGTNFAIGGAETGALPSIGLGGADPSWITSQAQMAAALGPLPGDGLYIVAGGGNDVREALTYLTTPGNPYETARAAMTDAVNNLTSTIATLAGAGASRFLVGNVPDVGRAPALQIADSLVPGTALAATTLATDLNLKLAAQLDVLRGLLPQIEIIELDTFSLFDAVLDNPGAFNFTNSGAPCVLENAGDGCSNPSEYVFWDGLHPTSAAHAVAAAQALSLVSVPVPAALWLFGVGVVALTGFRRRVGNT